MKASNWKKKINDIAQKVMDAQDAMKGWEDNLEIDGKNLEVCCIQHSSHLAYYDEIAVELKYTLDFVDMVEKQVRGELLKHMKDTFVKEYTDSSIQKVIDANPEYLEVHELYLIVQEQYDKARSIVRSFEQRSYVLNNIVKIREKELEHVVVRAT